MSSILSVIKKSFRTRPILTNSLIYGTLFVSAEFSQQYVTKKISAEQPEPLDKEILGRYAFYGTFIQGPILTIWYRWLDKKFVGTALTQITKKVLIDQFCMTPPLYAIFFISMSIMESKPDILNEFQEKFAKTFKTSCMFWLPVQSINFLLIPPSYRVIYVGTSSLIWVNILCWIKRQKTTEINGDKSN